MKELGFEAELRGAGVHDLRCEAIPSPCPGIDRVSYEKAEGAVACSPRARRMGKSNCLKESQLPHVHTDTLTHTHSRGPSTEA